MKKCLNCDHMQDDNLVRCEKCGRLIDKKEEHFDKKYSMKCPACEEIVSVKFKKGICPYCGAEFPKNTFGFTSAEAAFIMLNSNMSPR